VGTNGIKSLLKQTYAEWSEDKGPRLGAELACYAIFSIPPLLMIAIAGIGLVYSGDIRVRLQAQLAILIGSDAAKTLLTFVRMDGHKAGWIASIIGIGVLMFGASGVFAELQDALDTIWRVKPKEEGLKGLLKGRFPSFTMVLGTCFLLLVSLIISSVVSAMSARFAAWMPGGEVLAQILDTGSSFLVISVLFAMIFKVLPDVKIRWKDVWFGAVLTAILFTIGKFAIGMYIGKSGIGSGYGAAGALVVLVTWVYYSSQLLILGAEFTQVWTVRHSVRVIPEENAEPLVAAERAAQGLTPVLETTMVTPSQRQTPTPVSSGPLRLEWWNPVLVSVAWTVAALLLSRNEPWKPTRI
jgi:membrane protein